MTSTRVAAALAALAIVAASAAQLRDPLATMTGFTAALMALDQLVPPLLLLAVRPRFHPDPILAALALTALTVAVGIPALLDPTLADALFAAPLGALELAAGLLVWAQFFPASRSIASPQKLGAYALLCGTPMTVVATVWMLADRVLYTPYLDTACRWNLSPLADQRLAGFAMLVSGLPLQLVGAWFLAGLSSARSVPDGSRNA